MVIKELLALWHDDSALAEILKKFDEMLLTAKEMFSLTTLHLTTDTKGQEVGHKIIKMDGGLNVLQQVIRRDVVTHITVQGTADLIPCLQLMSLIKDAERVGDYCKNIHEIISRKYDIRSDPLLQDAIGMRAKILLWFDQTIRAFDRMDTALAKSTREEAYFMEKECDRLVWALSDDNQGRNAVSIAMLIRFFKRIAAHLGNICTSVVMPLDKLDYFQKPGGTTIVSDED